LENRQVRAAIYARCSTAHSDQKPEVQIEELRRYCHARGWTITKEIIDHGYSGSSSNRPGLKELLTLTHNRHVDVVVVVKLDRLFRSLKHLVVTLQEFTDLGVEFVSLKDQLDMTTASGRLLVHIIGAFAEFEKSLISERTKMGIEHARNKGKQIGRPKAPTFVPFKIIDLREQGLSYREICRRTGYSMGMVTRTIKAHRKPPENS
tara:strand:+ start:3041 stop:3658 length:618 start_codon:yes stop_codon:yes gene_type:complete